MKVWPVIVLVSLFQFNISHAQFNSGEYQASQAALDARNEFLGALLKKDFASIAQKGFDRAVQELIRILREDYLDEALASDLSRQWGQSQAHFIEQAEAVGLINDLGDHAPLFDWLEKFFMTLEDKYGSMILNVVIVKRVRDMNFAIPVVFHPKGDWQTAQGDNRIEYRKHFIPFVNTVTYYLSLFACNRIAQQNGQPDLKKMCKKVSEKLEWAMGRYVAPLISDWIFKQTTRSLQIGNDRLRYVTPGDLKREI